MNASCVAPENTGKINSLTTLRFFAAAMIVIYHGNEILGTKILVDTVLGQGVSFFFVLSGLVLAYAYPSLNNKKDTIKFLWSRLSRLWPAHVFSTLIMMLTIKFKVDDRLLGLRVSRL